MLIRMRMRMRMRLRMRMIMRMTFAMMRMKIKNWQKVLLKKMLMRTMCIPWSMPAQTTALVVQEISAPQQLISLPVRLLPQALLVAVQIFQIAPLSQP